MIGTHKTTQRVSNEDNNRILSVVYHNTEVVKVINDNQVILNNGGYYTATTKKRMNQASMQYNLGFDVYQSDFCWYVRTANEIVEYYNGVVIDIENKCIRHHGEWD